MVFLFQHLLLASHLVWMEEPVRMDCVYAQKVLKEIYVKLKVRL